jgi:hypothetical protein
VAEFESLAQVHTNKDWAKLMDYNSVHNCLYNLLIIEEIAQNDKSGEWKAKFLQKEGLYMLCLILSTIEV